MLYAGATRIPVVTRTGVPKNRVASGGPVAAQEILLGPDRNNFLFVTFFARRLPNYEFMSNNKKYGKIKNCRFLGC